MRINNKLSMTVEQGSGSQGCTGTLCYVMSLNMEKITLKISTCILNKNVFMFLLFAQRFLDETVDVIIIIIIIIIIICRLNMPPVVC